MTVASKYQPYIDRIGIEFSDPSKKWVEIEIPRVNFSVRTFANRVYALRPHWGIRHDGNRIMVVHKRRIRQD